MKICKVLTEKTIITFLFIMVIFVFPAKAKEQDARIYKSKIEVSDNFDRINWQWWEKFRDTVLLQALKASLNNNFDILIADFKVKESKNYLESSRREHFPLEKFGGDFLLAKPSLIDSYGRKRNYINSAKGLIFIPMEFNYELDIWGKRKNRRKYLSKAIDIAEFEKNFIILTAVSDVSTLYFNILKNEKIIMLYEQIYGLKKEKLGINLEKYRAELVTRPEIIRIKKELNAAKSELNTLKAVNEELKNQFYYLVAGDKEKTFFVFSNIEDIELFYDTGCEINTSRIANRPDVLIAESGIKMAQIDVKLARRALLPSFHIKGDFIHVTNMFKDFFKPENIMNRLGAGISYDLLSKNNNISELDAKKNIYNRALKTYEKAIVSSITDVNNSLILLKSSIDNYNRAKEDSGLNNENMQIQQQKLEMDLIDYEDYIESAESFIRAKIFEYESKTQCLIHSISLYKALGGNV